MLVFLLLLFISFLRSLVFENRAERNGHGICLRFFSFFFLKLDKTSLEREALTPKGIYDAIFLRKEHKKATDFWVLMNALAKYLRRDCYRLHLLFFFLTLSIVLSACERYKSKLMITCDSSREMIGVVRYRHILFLITRVNVYNVRDFIK